jgi:hypothetical protein
MNANAIHDLYAMQREAANESPPMMLPADEPPVQCNERSVLGLVELLLKDPERLDALNREEGRQAEFIPRFLGIALAAYTLFAVALLLILNAAPAECYPHRWLEVPAAGWQDGSALSLLLAYDLGLVGATGICLPSFYFFGLLAGVRMSMLQLTGQVVRCKASSAVVLVGILPIYVAVVLGMVVFAAPGETLEWLLYLGLVLPFVAGLEGARALYHAVLGMADTLPPARRAHRERFLRRLTLSWAAVYTAVSPLLIFRLWQFFAGQIAG